MSIVKPPQCEGCPFQKLSKYITPDYIIPDSEILLLAQAPGQHEEEGLLITGYGKYPPTEKVRPQPLIGKSGQWLRKEFWPLTRIDYHSISRANVIKCRPYNSNDLPNIGSNKSINEISVKELKEAISHCVQHYLKIPEKTKHIMAMGEVSLYALTGEELLNYKSQHIDDNTKEPKKSTVGEWRGWVLGRDFNDKSVGLLGLREYYIPMGGSSLYERLIDIFPVVHLASLFQNEKFYHGTLDDFKRFGQLVRNEWPLSTPEIKINEIPSSIPNVIGFDTEYTKNNELIMWSMSDVYGNTYVVDSEYSRELRNLPSTLTLITQNGIVDFPHFLPLLPLDIHIELNMEDCMLAWATKWTGEPYGLDYMLSRVGKYNRHKHLRESRDKYTSYFYAGLDANTTLNHVWKYLVKEFEKDKLAWNEYKLRRQPLLSIISKSQQKGAKIYQKRVKLISQILDSKIEEIEKGVKELTGNPDFNIRSHEQVKKALYYGNFSSTVNSSTSSINNSNCYDNNPIITKRNSGITKRSNKVKNTSKTRQFVDSIVGKLEERFGD